jgi:LruC domain-containing protein
LDYLKDGKINLDIFAVFDTRGKEVHFKGQLPTNKFTIQYFMSTRPKMDFSTVDNWVWAVLSPKSIRHPLEFVKIYNAYPNFKTWAEAGGEVGVDWYNNTVRDSLWTKHNFNYVN